MVKSSILFGSTSGCTSIKHCDSASQNAKDSYVSVDIKSSSSCFFVSIIRIFTVASQVAPMELLDVGSHTDGNFGHSRVKSAPATSNANTNARARARRDTDPSPAAMSSNMLYGNVEWGFKFQKIHWKRPFSKINAKTYIAKFAFVLQIQNLYRENICWVVCSYLYWSHKVQFKPKIRG